MTDKALVDRLRKPRSIFWGNGSKEPNQAYPLLLEAADALEASLAREERLREALDGISWWPGGWDAISHIEYCRFCNYSRKWVADHGHGNTCPLHVAALQGSQPNE